MKYTLDQDMYFWGRYYPKLPKDEVKELCLTLAEASVKEQEKILLNKTIDYQQRFKV